VLSMLEGLILTAQIWHCIALVYKVGLKLWVPAKVNVMLVYIFPSKTFSAKIGKSVIFPSGEVTEALYMLKYLVIS